MMICLEVQGTSRGGVVRELINLHHCEDLTERDWIVVCDVVRHLERSGISNLEVAGTAIDKHEQVSIGNHAA